ncbi:MAG: helix-turn-helix domain-containing protein [Treponema sp.]|nr:helix-turn-helix domain-containing protein [Treponema sp.]
MKGQCVIGKVACHPVINLQKTGKNIKLMRERRGLSVQGLADYMEFEAVQTVYNWQAGKALPTLENLKILSDLFNTPMEEILIFEQAS